MKNEKRAVLEEYTLREKTLASKLTKTFEAKTCPEIAFHQSDSAQQVEIGVWHLFIRTKIRFSKNREKRRKTKKTRENLGFFGWHLFCQLVLAVMVLKDAAL